MMSPATAAIVLLLTACATTLSVRQPPSWVNLAAANSAIEGRRVEIAMGRADERERDIKSVTVGRDSTQWLERPTTEGKWRQVTVPTAALTSITWRTRAAGFGRGVAWGLLFGAVAGT